MAAAGLRRAIDAHGGESILPYSYAGTQGLVQGNLMSQRVMNALGASELVRTICATAGIAGVGATHGLSPEVDPEEWPHARYLLLWGWNPMSTAPHLWRLLLETQRSGARLVVVDPLPQPHGAAGGRAPAAAARHGRRARAGNDARDPRRRAGGRGLVPRPRDGPGRAARASSTSGRSTAPPR